jgi:putative SOS response-associated peptidase YedK
MRGSVHMLVSLNTSTWVLFSFANGSSASPDVAPIHPDATPVLLLDEAAREQWMNAPMEDALLLQKPPPAGALKIVAAGEKQDAADLMRKSAQS